MKNDLIRRSDVIQVFNELLKSPYASNKDSRDALKLARGVFQDDVPKWLSIHAVDAVKVRHGRWIQKEDKDWAGGGKTMCSKCKYGYSWKMYFEPESFKYCPNCGARMDGQRREDGDNNAVN